MKTTLFALFAVIVITIRDIYIASLEEKGLTAGKQSIWKSLYKKIKSLRR